MFGPVAIPDPRVLPARQDETVGCGLGKMPCRRLVALLLIGHVLIWTIYAVVARSSGAVHHDMMEAWTWGKQFQLGYYKHPPFYAWVAGLWFQVLPRQDWSFYLLSATNAGVGLAGVWFLAGRLLPSQARIAAVLLLMLVPSYGFLAINFNANSILLAVWPWTAYFFLRSLQTRRLHDGVLFGALAAVALLSKYFSLFLLTACFAASLLHPQAQKYYRSRAPYAAVVVMAALLAPHAWWVVEHDLQTIKYAMDKLDYSPHLARLRAVQGLLSYPLFWGLPLLGLVAAFRGEAARLVLHGHAGLLRRDRLWIGALAFGPFLLTVLSGTLGHAKTSTNFMIPVFFMVPIALATTGGEINRARLAVIGRVAAGVLAAALLASPIVAVANFMSLVDMASEPRRELGVEATRLWHEAFVAPLRIVAGSLASGRSISFYAEDGPDEFIQLRYDLAPWVTPSRLAREGLLIACQAFDAGCLESGRAAAAVPGGRHETVALEHKFLWWKDMPMKFEIFMVPPGTPPAELRLLHK